jgi:hypothetical protein
MFIEEIINKTWYKINTLRMYYIEWK